MSVSIAPAVAAGLLAAGVRLPLLIPVWLCLTSAAVAFLAPRRPAAHAAAEARTAFGSPSVPTSTWSRCGWPAALVWLRPSATLPRSAPVRRSRKLRGALADARTDGLSPAASLGRLGAELHLPDLVDTATRLALVDTTGAQAQASLRAQAASLRDRELPTPKARPTNAPSRCSSPRSSSGSGS